MSKEITSYTFGALQFRVQGLGVFFAGPKLIAKIEALSPEQLRDANSAAWKLRRSSERLCERYANVTIHGNRPHDEAHSAFMVADVVCKTTWRAMQERLNRLRRYNLTN